MTYHNSNEINRPYLFYKLRIRQVAISLLLISTASTITFFVMIFLTTWWLTFAVGTSAFIGIGYYVQRAMRSNTHPDPTYREAKKAAKIQPKRLYDYDNFIHAMTHA